ncbi:MAG: S8 family serine peptidase [Planctomycetes bacterium]|nr:S8 family serine peptidase [Planctomycetota bacterium]
MASTAFRRAAPLAALFVLQLAAWAQDPAARSGLDLAPIVDGKPLQGLPGEQPGTERWVVHFATRSFDLAEFRDAVRARKSAAEVARIVAGLEAKVQADQAGFVAAAQALGARVAEQWWIVNAAVFEIAPSRLADLRALANIAFVEPDVAVQPWIITATNSANHNADLLQSQGHRGLGVTVGIMDTGQDSDMNGLARPHRAYYVGGDPNNTSGGGINGSRLVVNRQIGALVADDQNGHGTGVASISAGADWGTASADDGHAPLAQIAGYAIANQVSGGGSSTTTMASAWQSMAADRVAFDIVAANLSYGGSPSPTAVDQQALDSAALNADIMICVAAGNSGPAAGSTTGSQGAANGLAVGALNANSHTVASFSSRGPLSGDTARFYPDIAACGVSTVMAARNNEAGNYTGSGTSMASPQVAGAATQLRGRFTALTALETKAILLASTLDISSQNAGLTRNDFGMGILKNDRAHALTAANRYGRATLSSGAPEHTFTIPAVQGGSYAVAIAWHRLNTSSSTWSNLDLEILDGSGAPIVSSTTTRNLYEMVRFFNPFPGPLTVRTRGVSLAAGSQEFSFAWTEHPTVAFPGSAVSFGAGCAGSVTAPGLCASINPNGGAVANNLRAYEYGYDLTSAAAIGVQSFEIYSRSNTGGAVTVSAAIYGATGGTPTTAPLAITTVTIGATDGFYRGTFAGTVNLPAGPFWIGIDHAAQTTLLSQISGGTQTGGAYYRTGFGSSANWTRSGLITAPSFRVYCAPVPAVPALAASAAPRVSGSFALQLSACAPSIPAFYEIGFSNTSWGALPLPFSFAPLGGGTCSLLVSADIGIGTSTNAQGSASQNFSVPNQTLLIGARFFAQGLVFDAPANALGIVSSNGLRLTIGN